MKPMRSNSKVAALAILVTLTSVQSAGADGLGANLGATVQGATRTVSSVTADVTSSITTGGSSNTGSNDTHIADVNANANVSPNSGVTAFTCIRLFGRCPTNQNTDTQGVAHVDVNAAAANAANGANNANANINANVGGNTGNCLGLFRRCDNAQQAPAAEPAAATPPQGTPAQRTMSGNNETVATAPNFGGNPFDANDVRGVILMSKDNEVLGIVQQARWMEDGSMLVEVQISGTIGVSRTVTSLQFRPLRQPTDRITFGVTAREFAASVS